MHKPVFVNIFSVPSRYPRLTASPLGYRISWEEFNRTNTRVTHYLPNLTQEYKVTGLTALTTYTIQVAAMTAKGQGQLSASTISSGVPPGQTEKLRQLNPELIQAVQLTFLKLVLSTHKGSEIFFFFVVMMLKVTLLSLSSSSLPQSCPALLLIWPFPTSAPDQWLCSLSRVTMARPPSPVGRWKLK